MEQKIYNKQIPSNPYHPALKFRFFVSTKIKFKAKLSSFSAKETNLLSVEKTLSARLTSVAG
jgi:hypothetical protein